MKVSACVIAKNEGENIETCIRSCLKIADEVIVADTGSDDDTVAKAGALGAQVFSFPWTDDFAAAKNFALSKAAGDWIFFPDADEYIDDETAALFLEEIKKNDKTGVEALTAILYNIDRHTGEVQKGVEITRVFKNTGEIFYKGKIHEKLAHKNGQPVHIVLSKARIYHTGYTQALLPQKHERNLRMLLAAEKDGDADTISTYHIAGTLFSMGRYEEAMAYIEQIEKSHDFMFLIKHFSLMSNFFAVKAQTMAMLGERYTYDEICGVIRAGIEYYPDDYRLLEEKISIGMLWGRYDEVMDDYRKAISLYDKAEAYTGFSHKRDRSRMFAGMARIFLMKGQKEKAFDCYVQAVTADYTFGIALAGLLDLLRRQPAGEIIAFLSRIYDGTVPEQRGFLAFITASAIMPEVFFHFFYGMKEEKTVKYRRYQVYAALFSGDYDEAAQIGRDLLHEEKNPEKAKELKILLRVSGLLAQYVQRQVIKDEKTDESFIGTLEILLKLDQIQAAELFLDCIDGNDKNTLLKVADLMKNIGYYDAATDFYRMLADSPSAREGLAFCAFQRGDREEAKRLYRAIKSECKAAAQFLKWMEEPVC